MKRLYIQLLTIFVLFGLSLTITSDVNAQTYSCIMEAGSCRINANNCPDPNAPLPASCNTLYNNSNPHTCPPTVNCTTGLPTSNQTTPPNQQPPTNTTPADPNSVLVDLNGLVSALSGLSSNQSQFNKLTTLGGFIGALLPFLYAIAGIALLGFLIAGGFMYLTSAGDPKRTEAAKTIITTAIIGFIIVIVAFWATQMVQYIFLLKTSGGGGFF